MKENDDFWAGVERSARLVQGAPKWTQAGLVLSENYNGFDSVMPTSLTIGQKLDSLLEDAREYVDEPAATEWLLRWMGRPQPYLSGQTPLEALVDEKGFKLCQKLLGSIMTGTYL